jgi:hypothetical protein
VVSYTTVSPLPVSVSRERVIGGLFSVALSVGFPRLGVTQHPALWSPDFPRTAGEAIRDHPVGSLLLLYLRRPPSHPDNPPTTIAITASKATWPVGAGLPPKMEITRTTAATTKPVTDPWNRPLKGATLPARNPPPDSAAKRATGSKTAGPPSAPTRRATNKPVRKMAAPRRVPPAVPIITAEIRTTPSNDPLPRDRAA